MYYHKFRRRSVSYGENQKLYGWRWGIERSFRELKYTIGLTNFHSKKAEYIQQEIFARLIIYNFCERIITGTEIKQKNRKYVTRSTSQQPF
ncbi:MAG: transposase [Lachnospiraceae bacterium]|nr:transposase [Lachnospiraceae bacterium]